MKTIAAAVLCLVLAAAVPGCALTDPGADRDATRQVLEQLQAERDALADQLELVRTQLAELEAAAADTGNSELAAAAAELESKLSRGQAVLAQLELAVDRARAELEASPRYEDTVAQNISDAGAAARGAAVVLPPPFGEVVGLVGVLLGVGAAAWQRSRRQQATEAVRDLAKGLDAFYDASAAQGDRETAEQAWSTVHKQLSSASRKVVAQTGEHPLGTGA